MRWVYIYIYNYLFFYGYGGGRLEFSFLSEDELDSYSKNFAQTSLETGNELLLIRKNQRNPHLFEPSLHISMNLKHDHPVYLIINAINEDQLHAVELSELYRSVLHLIGIQVFLC